MQVHNLQFLAGISLCTSRKITECEVWGGHQSSNLFVARLKVDAARPLLLISAVVFLTRSLLAEAWTAGIDTHTGEGNGN